MKRGRIENALALILFLVSFSPLAAEARDRELLNKALANSTKERAGVEREYKSNGALGRKADDSDVHAISVELGDELSSMRPDEGMKSQARHSDFRERGVSAKLDREWREVNEEMGERPEPMHRAAHAISRPSISRPSRASGKARQRD